jgi:hypothetical protein
MKIIAFDIDDVLLTRKKDYNSKNIEKYKLCTPIVKNIDLINKCYEMGYHIKLYTSRGMTSLNGDIKKINENILPLTLQSLEKYGIKYHELIFGKEHYDLLIDDKALNIDSVNSIEDIIKYFGE